MPQPLPNSNRTRVLPAPPAYLVRSSRTWPDCPPDPVPAQPHCLEDFRTKSTGEGDPPSPSKFPTSAPLPLSAVFMDNERGCAWPDRTSFRKKIQDGQQGPKALCRGVSGGRTTSLPFPKQAACQPRWLATIGELTKCARSSHCSARSVRTGTTPPPRTRRRPLAALSSQSSAIPAVSTRRTKRRSKSTLGIQPSAMSEKLTAPGGVSSTVKLSVSKTELLGSNPSSPASFPGFTSPKVAKHGWQASRQQISQ